MHLKGGKINKIQIPFRIYTPMHHPRKRRTRAHILEDLSINHLEYFVFRCGFATQRIYTDYGLDLILYTFDNKLDEARNYAKMYSKMDKYGYIDGHGG